MRDLGALGLEQVFCLSIVDAAGRVPLQGHQSPPIAPHCSAWDKATHSTQAAQVMEGEKKHRGLCKVGAWPCHI